MRDAIAYLLHAPDRATFLAVMAQLKHPLDGQSLAALDEDGRLVPHRDVRIDEIGAIVRGHAEGEDWIEDSRVEGWHVNVAAVGALAAALGGQDGILAFLGEMQAMNAAGGVPGGLQGASGVRILDASEISTPERVWA